MDLQQLRYFRSVARLQHMTRAAEECQVTQPSLSRGIRLLETELGVDLFDRKGRGIRLNGFGRAFSRHVEVAFQALEDGRRELEDLASSQQDELVISAAALHWSSGLFKAFSERSPDVRFRLYQRTPAEMVRQLARREVDLCFMVDPGLETIEWRPLVEGELWVVVPPGHRLQGRGAVTMEELRGEPAIVPREGLSLRNLIDDCYRESGVPSNIVCESDDPSAVREFVLAGLGIRFVPDLGHALANGTDPRCLHLTDPRSALRMGMAWPCDGYRSRAAQDFAAFAVAFIENEYPSPNSAA
ncbi:LysR family transcriptional regulator [soil metagenome]